MSRRKLSDYLGLVRKIVWRYRREAVISTCALGGWITYKYLPYSKLVHDSGLLLNGTQMRARREIERLRGIGYKLEKDLDRLSGIVNHIPRNVIEQAVDDINRSRKRPLDVSKVNFATSLAVHVGSEYHSGSLRNGAFIVLPGTFGLTEKEKSIYKAAKYYFDNSSLIFSLLDKNTWKFMVAKELLYLEDERNTMKFSMYLGSVLFTASFIFFGSVVMRKLYSKEYIYELTETLKGNSTQTDVIMRRVKGRQTGNSLLAITLLAISSLFMYKLSLYTYCRWRTTQIDQTLARLGQEYIDGGKNYFQKMQDAGYFQHHLLANKNYNNIGNENMDRFLFLVPKTVTRDERLDFYSSLCKKEG